MAKTNQQQPINPEEHGLSGHKQGAYGLPVHKPAGYESVIPDKEENVVIPRKPEGYESVIPDDQKSDIKEPTEYTYLYVYKESEAKDITQAQPGESPEGRTSIRATQKEGEVASTAEGKPESAADKDVPEPSTKKPIAKETEPTGWRKIKQDLRSVASRRSTRETIAPAKSEAGSVKSEAAGATESGKSGKRGRRAIYYFINEDREPEICPRIFAMTMIWLLTLTITLAVIIQTTDWLSDLSTFIQGHGEPIRGMDGTTPAYVMYKLHDIDEK